jgi:hypothetical protein
MTGTQGNGLNKKKIYMSFAGLPLTFDLHWPFRPSTGGSDFWVLHGTIRVENAAALYAPVSVNLSATVREVMNSLEPNHAEAPVINALRKEVDRKQVEFLKSAKLLPVNFSSRHYDFKRGRWVFEKATEEQITQFIERKIFWQTRVTGGEVWIADDAEAQYLDTSAHHLSEAAAVMAQQGLWTMERAYATATDKLMAEAERFEREAAKALEDLEKKHAFERA